MKYKLISIAAIIICAIGLFFYDITSTPPSTSLPNKIKADTQHPQAPIFPIKTLSGKTFNNLSNFQEPVILLHFWATWCTTCIAEMPDLIALIEKMRGKAALVAISIDDTIPPLNKYLSRLEKKHPSSQTNPHIYWVHDSDKSISLKHFNVIRTPETILINSNRQMAKKIVGEHNWLSQQTQDLINELAN